MPDISVSPSTPVTNGANVSTSNPLPVYLVGGVAATAITVGTTTIGSGTASGILWSNSGVLASGPALTDATGNITLPAAGAFGWTALSKIIPQADGIITLLNNAGTGFTRLQFGGTTSSFPALSPNGSRLNVVLADGTSLGASINASILEAGIGTAIAAGGTNSIGVRISSSLLGVYAGSGVPTLSAAKGSLYLRSDGSGIADRIYVNTNGTTSWTNLVSAA